MTAEVVTHTDVAIEAMFERLIKSQQPFFSSVMNQMNAIENRLIAQDTSIGEVKTAIAVMTSAQFATKLEALDKRLDAMEAENNKRKGMMVLVNMVPKLFIYLVILVGIIVAWKMNLLSSVGH